jgi:hypothetical protein
VFLVQSHVGTLVTVKVGKTVEQDVKLKIVLEDKIPQTKKLAPNNRISFCLFTIHRLYD